jgi:hypothetical protein
MLERPWCLSLCSRFWFIMTDVLLEAKGLYKLEPLRLNSESLLAPLEFIGQSASRMMLFILFQW